MNLIETIAPIAIDDLKKYFTDKTSFYLIDYTNSSLKGTKLLTYLSNLDLPSDIKDPDDELLKEYLHFPMLCNILSLEMKTIELLLEYKDITTTKNYTQFIQDNQEIVEKWANKLDSLTVYNMHTIKVKEFQDFVSMFPVDETTELVGVNFLSLLKNPEFYLFYNKIDKKKLKFYKAYFNDYMFKGKSLYTYWANENNPLFMLTYGIGEGLVTKEDIENKQGALDAASIQ